MAEQLQCNVCCKRSTAFFCLNCIKNGDFTSSRSHEVLKERFAEKKLRLYQLRQLENEYNEKLHQLFATDLTIDTLNDKFNAQKVNLDQLRKELTTKQMQVNKAKECLNEILQAQARVQKEKSKLLTKIASAANHIEKRKQQISRRIQKREEVAEKIKEITRERISQLTRYVFPIETYLPDENPETGLISSEENTPLLTFSGGSTNSSTNSGSEIKYTVIEPWLPTNGDYSAYDEWVMLHKEITGTASEFGQRNPAFRISSALAYAAQLLHVISFYLDVRFPKRLKFSEFYSTSASTGNDVFLSENEFAHKVAKLNINIIYFCLFQNVDSRLIHPKQTIANLQLLNCPVTADLGRTGPVRIESKFCQKLKNALLDDISLVNEPELMEDENDNVDDIDLQDFDWEALPYMPQVADQSVYSQQSTSYVSGFFSTATASVASFWRAAAGHK